MWAFERQAEESSQAFEVRRLINSFTPASTYDGRKTLLIDPVLGSVC